MIRFRSVTTRAIVAAIRSVARPMKAAMSAAVSPISKSGWKRAIR